MNEKIYCGNGRKIETKYGELMKLSFTAKDLKALADNLKNGWVNAVIKERREPSEKGITHYLTIDFWEPENNDIVEAEVIEPKHIPDPQDLDELPF